MHNLRQPVGASTFHLHLVLVLVLGLHLLLLLLCLLLRLRLLLRRQACCLFTHPNHFLIRYHILF
jgi:hypothetical protein